MDAVRGILAWLHGQVVGLLATFFLNQVLIALVLRFAADVGGVFGTVRIDRAAGGIRALHLVGRKSFISLLFREGLRNHRLETGFHQRRLLTRRRSRLAAAESKSARQVSQHREKGSDLHETEGVLYYRVLIQGWIGRITHLDPFGHRFVESTAIFPWRDQR